MSAFSFTISLVVGESRIQYRQQADGSIEVTVTDSIGRNSKTTVERKSFAKMAALLLDEGAKK